MSELEEVRHQIKEMELRGRIQRGDWDTPSQLDRIEDMLKEILAHLKKPKRAQKRSEAVTCSAWDAFWSSYPRKVSKKAALQAWNGLNQADKQQILEVMPAWVESWKGTDVQFIPHPSTWINKRRFDDPVEMAVPKEKQQPRSDQEWIDEGKRLEVFSKPGESMGEFIKRVKGAMYK